MADPEIVEGGSRKEKCGEVPWNSSGSANVVHECCYLSIEAWGF